MRISDPPTPATSDAPRRGWVAALLTAVVGVAIGWFAPISILLPAQAATLAGDGGKEALLALVIGSGAGASMLANPAWGALSDRVRARTGSRTPVLLAGTAVGLVGLVLLAVATAPAVMLTGWIVTQIGLNGPFAVLAASIADRVPERRRGWVGSLFGVAQLVGTVVGTALATVTGGGAIGYIAVVIAVPLLVLPIVFTRPGSPPVAAERVAPAADEGRISWRVSGTFVAAFLLRFLINLVSALGLLYLFFFLTDRAGIDVPDTWVLVLTVCYAAVAMISAVVGGALSDRYHRRRPVMAAASLLLALGAVAMAFAVDIPFIIAAVVVLGIGYGAFLAVDVAIVTDALPDARTRGTLLGVANLGSSLPQVLAPVIAAPVVTGVGGYTALYLATAVVALLALPLIPLLRGIR
ncbi:MFS transporter [Microbacterium sp. P05]|uniref:MFS transporter n=1 Tax=Microbacterium sp. P05 TaxID=3366948 RepID=UPI0037472A30